MASPNRKPGSSDWPATGYWTTGSAPASTDSATVDAGGDTINQNMDQSAVDLTALYVGPGFKGNIDALLIDVNQGGAGVFTYDGSGQRMSIGRSGGTLAKVVMQNTAGTAVLSLLNGAVTLLEVLNGMVIVAGGCTPATIRMMGGDCVVQYNSGNLVTTIDAMAGRLHLQRDFTTLNLGEKAVVTWDGDGDSGALTGGAVNLNGGLLKWLRGSLGALTLKAGGIDMTAIQKAGLAAASITHWYGTKLMYPAGSKAPNLGSETLVGGGATKSYGGSGTGTGS